MLDSDQLVSGDNSLLPGQLTLIGKSQMVVEISTTNLSEIVEDMFNSAAELRFPLIAVVLIFGVDCDTFDEVSLLWNAGTVVSLSFDSPLTVERLPIVVAFLQDLVEPVLVNWPVVLVLAGC